MGDEERHFCAEGQTWKLIRTSGHERRKSIVHYMTREQLQSVDFERKVAQLLEEKRL